VLGITEVAPWSSGNSPSGSDWFEVTNIGVRAVDISGWKMDDGSESPAAAVALIGVTSIAPGESVIFVEYDTNAVDMARAFSRHWFGRPSAGDIQIGGYTGSGVGLSTGGDAVNLYDSHTPTPVRRASVSFGSSPSAAPFATFDNAAGLNVSMLETFSQKGVNGALSAAKSADEIGSPGSIENSAFLDAFNQWIADKGYTSAGPYSDSDGNGIRDLHEYFFNQDANNAADMANLPKLLRSGETLELKYSYQHGSELTEKLQVSSDLENWVDAVPEVDFELISETTEGEDTSVRYRILTGSRKTVFVRVVVED